MKTHEGNGDGAGAREKLIRDQREANTEMVHATIRAQEATERAEALQRELRELSDIREMFIAILGHDLRNPLSSIEMGTDLLATRGNLRPEQARTVARIAKSGQRMKRMITQLLAFTNARLGGGLPVDPKRADLREVCRAVIAEFAAGSTELEIEGDVSGCWDVDRLAEAFSNIIGNAIEHATPGTRVAVKAYALGAQVVVAISNQGEPIPEAMLLSIFEPFRQARPRNRSVGHLGLGLYIAHQIARSHGGTLTARSSGGTTTFEMRLPRNAPAESLRAR